MNKTNPYKFDAFISYSRKDEATAKKIERMLKNYAIPKAFTTEARKFQIFRDAEDLGLGELSEELQKSLDQSEFLIVICSPNSRKSNYVSKEIEYFGEKKSSKFIIPVLAHGRPNSEVHQSDKIQDQAFSESLYKYFNEPLAADFRIFENESKSTQKKKLEEARFQVIAKLLKTDKSEELVGRERRRIRKRNTLITSILGIAVAGSLLFPFNDWGKLNFKLDDPSQEVIKSCEVIDQKVNTFSKSTAKKLLYINRYEGVLDSGKRDRFLSDYTPTNRLLPEQAMNNEIRYEAIDKFGSTLERVANRFRNTQESKVDWWVGKPKTDSYIIIIPNHADYSPSIMSNPSIDPLDAMNPPEDDEYFAESVILTYHDGVIDTATISGLYPIYEDHDIHLRGPMHFIPSLGIPVSWEENDIWLATPMKKNGEKGILLHSDDNGANWKEQKDFPNVYSIFRSDKSETYLTQKGVEYTSPAGVITLIDSEIFKYNEDTKKWKKVEGPVHGAKSEVECCGFVNDNPVIRVDKEIYINKKTNIIKTLLFNDQ